MAISSDAGVVVVPCGLSAILDTGGADVTGADKPQPPCKILAVPTASGSDVVSVPCSKSRTPKVSQPYPLVIDASPLDLNKFRKGSDRKQPPCESCAKLIRKYWTLACSIKNSKI